MGISQDTLKQVLDEGLAFRQAYFNLINEVRASASRAMTQGKASQNQPLHDFALELKYVTEALQHPRDTNLYVELRHWQSSHKANAWRKEYMRRRRAGQRSGLEPNYSALAYEQEQAAKSPPAGSFPSAFGQGFGQGPAKDFAQLSPRLVKTSTGALVPAEYLSQDQPPTFGQGSPLGSPLGRALGRAEPSEEPSSFPPVTNAQLIEALAFNMTPSDLDDMFGPLWRGLPEAKARGLA